MSDKIVSLDEHRIRSEKEFEDRKVAYVEALWGEETMAFNLAIRDLEAMRRGSQDLQMRSPETYHEVYHLVLHIRSLANDVAEFYGLSDLVRPEDNLPQNPER